MSGAGQLRAGWRWAARFALAGGWLSCAGPIVDAQVHELDSASLTRIAVAPFQPASDLRAESAAGAPPQAEVPKQADVLSDAVVPPQSGVLSEGGVPPQTAAEAEASAAKAGAPAPHEVAELMARFASEAFAARGYEVIPASDVVRVFEAQGLEVPRGDVAALSATAAREFGATAMLVGTVHRYTERRGGDLGATRPASVGFELTLHAAPGARKLWSARFDHTQRALSEDLFRAPRYPGGGSRWLTAAELAEWGMAEAVKAVAKLQPQ